MSPLKSLQKPGCTTNYTTYPGGKNGAGVYQTIICNMPPHSVYIEPFLGSGGVMRRKRPAGTNIGLDRAQSAIDLTRSRLDDPDNYRLILGDGVEFLRQYKFTGSELIYLDPPYVLATRTHKKLYDFELTDQDHSELLQLIKTLPCMVMISGYHTALYADALADWSHITFQAMTRGGKMATEHLWFNFPQPSVLHDYRYLGGGYRERERLKRQKQRWIKRLKNMDPLQRQYMLEAIQEAWPGTASPFKTMVPATSS